MPGNSSFLFFFLCHIKWEKSWFGKLQVWSPYACYSEVYNGALRSCLSFWQLWLFFFYETQLLLASVLTKGFPVWLLLTGALIGPDFFHLMMDCAPGNFESFNISLHACLRPHLSTALSWGQMRVSWTFYFALNLRDMMKTDVRIQNVSIRPGVETGYHPG